jgi:hypothetical protein
VPTALANDAAAQAAGYRRVQLDRGASNPTERWTTRYHKMVAGTPGQAGGLITFEATSSISQADADTKALAQVNEWRNQRYGFAAAGGSKGASDPGGAALTVDYH